MDNISIQKTLSLSECELKTDGDKGVFSGYASKYNGTDSYGDTILPGAYAKVAAKAKNIPIFLNHASWEVPIGKYTKVEDRPNGLYVEGELTLSIQKAREVYDALKAGSMSGLSVGILLSKKDYDLVDDQDSWSGRVIKNVSELREISVCTFPADSKARISAVKTDGVTTIREFESALRDAGFSKSQAQGLIATARAVFVDEKSRRDSSDQVDKIQDAMDRILKKINH